MAKVIEFLIHLKDDELPEIKEALSPNNLEHVTTKWYAHFIDLDIITLENLVIAAHFMDINPLG